MHRSGSKLGREAKTVKFGLFLPNWGPFGDPCAVVELAQQAEESGWDGFFVWDHIHMDVEHTGPMVDPWITLAAAATATSTLRLGTMITPLARRRPWKVARESVSLDHLSSGRLTLGIGLGTPPEKEFGAFGEPVDDRTRARALDEGLDILRGLWKGQPLTYSGHVHHVEDVHFEPRPLQAGGIPLWGAGWWPNKRPFQRAATLDGVVPELRGGGTPSPSQVKEIREYVFSHREGNGSFDIVINGFAEERDPLTDLEDAGVTWWLERFEPGRYALDAARSRIQEGPV